MNGLKRLSGRVALVTGASRGIGRGIALRLGEAGAKVYITGRAPDTSLTAVQSNLPTLEQTAEDIERKGGKAVPLYLDHRKDHEVKEAFKRVAEETGENLHILVNNVFSGSTSVLKAAGRKFYECEPELWDEMNEVGLRNHYFCSVYAARLMAKRREGGMIVNISSAGGLQYIMNVPYGVGKAALDRMTADMAIELKPSRIAVVSIWPGAVKTELTLATLEDEEKLSKLCIAFGGISKEQLLEQVKNGETPDFVGKAVVGLACDSKIMKKSGRIHITGDLAKEYNFTDVNGVMPSNMRSVRSALEFFGWPRLAKLYPAFVKVPKEALHFGSFKF